MKITIKIAKYTRLVGANILCRLTQYTLATQQGPSLSYEYSNIDGGWGLFSSRITVKKSVGGGCDNEAIRLLQETVWIPAEKNKKYVRSTGMQDITFSIGSHNFQDGNSY